MNIAEKTASPTKKSPLSRRESGLARVALAGNKNCGKSALFNLLTGGNRQVANYPGVTVDVASARVKGRKMLLFDLPGVYSLSPYSGDERVTGDFLLSGRADAIINVIDAANPERGLALTLSLLKLGIPTAVAFNMMDEARKKGISVDTNSLSAALGVRVIPVSARTGEGTDELLSAAEDIIASGKKEFSAAEESEKEICRKAKALTLLALKKSREETRIFSRADRILAQGKTALPMLILIMSSVFFVSFGFFGRFLSELAALLFSRISMLASGLMSDIGVSETAKGLVLDGVLAPVGSVLSFLPVIAVLFLMTGTLEDLGYMARAAFVTDRFFARFGLSGVSFAALFAGFGCSVPAVMASRTVGSKKARLLTVLILPFVPCGAKLPVASLVAGAVFGKNAFFVIAMLYSGSLLLGAIFLAAASRMLKSGGDEGFLLELPPYRVPSPKSVLRHSLARSREFIGKVLSVVLISGILIWLLQSFDLSFARVPADESCLSYIGRALALLLRPIGITDWRLAASLVTGLSAKETIIGTLSVLSGGRPDISMFGTKACALSFLTFSMLYTPCVSTLAAIARELGRRVSLFVCLFWLFVSYAVSFLVYNIAALLI